MKLKLDYWFAKMAVHTERKPMEKKHYKKLVKVMHSVEKDFGARLSPVPTKVDCLCTYICYCRRWKSFN